MITANDGNSMVWQKRFSRRMESSNNVASPVFAFIAQHKQSFKWLKAY
jgi:hypothetical protein